MNCSIPLELSSPPSMIDRIPFRDDDDFFTFFLLSFVAAVADVDFRAMDDESKEEAIVADLRQILEL